MPPRRLLYISLEYCLADLFSGNGVCARSQVRGLVALSHHVHVLCARPISNTIPDPSHPLIHITSIPLSIWYTTDRSCAHQQFANLAAKALNARHDLTSFHAILAVDWTGVNVLRALSQQVLSQLSNACIPIFYLSFRAYVCMADISSADRDFYREEETAAVHIALSSNGSVVTLCHDDDLTMRALIKTTHLNKRIDITQHNHFHVIHPMLRREFANIASLDTHRILDQTRTRMYLVSIVRLSEDKGVHRFVQLLRNLQRSNPDIWQTTGIVPVLCGAASQPEYAQAVRNEMKRDIKNAIIIDRFLNADDLATLLQNSVLNIHSGLYEAYGMTIVEAAAMGCPSVVHCEGIGATQLLRAENEEVVQVDVRDEDQFERVVAKLLTEDKWRWDVAKRAFEKAMSWTEKEHVDALVGVLEERLESKG